MNLHKLLCVFVLIVSATSSGLSAQEAASKPSVAKQPQPDEGWLVFRGDAGSTGVAKSDLPADLEVLWEYKVPNGAFDGTAVIARGKNDGQETVFIGDMDGVMHAIDLKTGKKKWDLNATISFSSSAAYRDGLIYIGDIDGFLYCIDESGKLKWKFETEGEINSSANFFDGQVLIGSQDSRIYLVDAASGKEIWKHQTPDQIQCSLTLAGDRAFVAGCDGFLHVIDLKDGHEVGTVDIHSPTQSTPAVLGERVFFGTEQAEFLAVNWKNVEGEWAFADDKGQASVRGCAAVTEGHVIFGAQKSPGLFIESRYRKNQLDTDVESQS